MAEARAQPDSGDHAVYTSVVEYVQRRCGTKTIEKILIANNGIAAVKAIRSIRKWSYSTFGREKAIKFVVMATPEDLAANAEYIRLADHYEEVPGGSNNNNFANVALIVDIAERTGVDAVWAGWGHASENPCLPEMLSKTKSNIAFIGPAAQSMSHLGDKISSIILAQSANVKCAPWSGDGVVIDYEKDGLPQWALDKCTVSTLEEARASLQQVGCPAMIKASEGGGGKGIRKVESPEELESAFRQVCGEVPGSPIFIMKLIPSANHLEVQILGDQYGNAVALSGRDCSVQRRHQKLIEEGPPIVADPSTWAEMEAAAVRLVKAVRYSGAGTVEYLYTPQGYTFLELNPRLQVEHPVTELIKDVNLPALQLNVAMGIPLHCIPEVRALYGRAPNGLDAIDFDNERQQPPHGHVIACRITAENAAEGFQPTSGGINELTFRSTPNVWGYFSVTTAGRVHDFADSQFGHLFAWGETREESRKRMVMALKELSIRGDISTSIDYLCFILETEEFNELRIDTSWLDSLIRNKVAPRRSLNESLLFVLCGCVFKAVQYFRSQMTSYIDSLERGQVPAVNTLSNTRAPVDVVLDNVKYNSSVVFTGPNSCSVMLRGSRVDVEYRELSDSGYLMLIDGHSHVVYGHDTLLGLTVVMDGTEVNMPREMDPTRLITNTPGKLVRYLVKSGSHVKAGTIFAEIEVMKMYIPLLVQEDGIIHFTRTEGAILQAGEVIAQIELDDPSRVATITVFEGNVPPMKPPRTYENKTHQQLRSTITMIENVLSGYYCHDLSKCVADMFKMLSSPDLPLNEFREVLAVVQSRLPKMLVQKVTSVLEGWVAMSHQEVPFPSKSLLAIIKDTMAALPELEAVAARPHAQALQAVCENYLEGNKTKIFNTVSKFLKQYLEEEALFQMDHIEDSLRALRTRYKNDMNKLGTIALGRAKNSQKSTAVVGILDQLQRCGLSSMFVSQLHELGALGGKNKGNIQVSLKARQLLIQYQLPSFDQRKVAVEDFLRFTINGAPESRLDRIESLIDQGTSMFDVLVSFFNHSNFSVKELAAEAYIRRAYCAYKIIGVKIENAPTMSAQWQFKLPDSGRGKSAAVSPSESCDNLVQAGEDHLWRGKLFIFETEEELRSKFADCLKTPWSLNLPHAGTCDQNVLKLFLYWNPRHTDEYFHTSFPEFLASHVPLLKEMCIRRITVALIREGHFPLYYTFKARLDWQEDDVLRHVEPPLAHNLELKRLSNYNISYCATHNRQIHMYYGVEKDSSTPEKTLFVRAVVRQGGVFVNNSMSRARDLLISEGESVISQMLSALEVTVKDPVYAAARNNRMFLKVLPNVMYDPGAIDHLVENWGRRYGAAAWKLKVTELEVAIVMKKDDGDIPLRFLITNPTGYLFCVDIYAEVRDPRTGESVLQSIGARGTLNNVNVKAPHLPASILQRKRFMAAAQSTAYAYDFIEIFREALREVWLNYVKKHRNAIIKPSAPPRFVKSVELVLNPDTKELEAVERPPGENTIGMVAWLVTLHTPEYPSGRDIVLIANDITFMIGSFGVQEDMLFLKASEFARRLGLPRIYISCNSGARIGLAEEVKRAFKVSWKDDTKPDAGFKYLYLEEDDYKRLSKEGAIACRQVEDGKWMLTDIIGKQDGLGVENLMGSGMIAGETSRAYNDTFTLTLATGRSVGIGAYLVRLGQRTIQNDNCPLILTGAAAINSMLGREVYTSNMQLGGPQIMHGNGVTHICVHDDYKSVVSAINWLGFVPRFRGAGLPILPSLDPVDRPVDFAPTRNPYDPRHFLAGTETDTGEPILGFFDTGSFQETMVGWARTVIVGRARLGGIPVAAIAVETRTMESVTPADPAAPESCEVVSQQPGQVFFPDSSYKTAQAIADFNNEGLPLIIFANWRGFSGGMRDMFDQILKFGSLIVDNLAAYRQPITIYIPPYGELRGGAWVVLDSTINPDMMEMYADKDCRGGVLEPSGVVEIKYRKPDLLKTMHRLDGKLQDMKRALDAAGCDEEAAGIQAAMQERENSLLAIYQQIAHIFADLHDTPGRMHAKNVVHGVVEWRWARKTFFHRLNRRMLEHRAVLQIRAASDPLFTDLPSRLAAIPPTHSSAQTSKATFVEYQKVCKMVSGLRFGSSTQPTAGMTYAAAKAQLQHWLREKGLADNAPDEEAANFIHAHKDWLAEQLRGLASVRLRALLQSLAAEHGSTVFASVLDLAKSLTAEEKAKLRAALE